jgi:hypothetical protein
MDLKAANLQCIMQPLTARAIGCMTLPSAYQVGNRPDRDIHGDGEAAEKRSGGGDLERKKDTQKWKTRVETG